MQNCSQSPAVCVKFDENDRLCDVDSVRVEKSNLKVSNNKRKKSVCVNDESFKRLDPCASVPIVSSLSSAYKESESSG